ncbi:hypothetical protein FSP39_008924 [Pinctada imbricata]|uniref:B box-type domain-containing protein n=1 Tax=Pinctada imbricata TaxID=66713 RepID=A0AA89BZ18_PINIB|nr:hypothetical protein FSP39_008924 [Pinctada imbricata]
MEPRVENRYSDLLTPVVCDSCAEENDVINYCLQCNANICSGCKHTHGDTRLTKGHIVLHRTHSEVIKARFSKRVYCPNHTGKEYVTYCVDCRQPCCATCIAEKHGGHAFSDLETILLQTESEVAELVRDVETNLIPLSKDALIMLEEEKASYKRVMEDVKLSSEEILRQHTKQLSKTQEAFLAEVDTLGENDLKYMEGKKQELEQNLENIKSVVLKGKTAPVDACIFHLRDDLVEASALKPRQMTCPGKLSFHMTSFQLSSGPDAIGSISNDTEKILFNLKVQDQEGVSNEGGLDAKYVKPMLLKTINGIFAKLVICTHNNDVLIFNEDDKSIALYDADSIKQTKTINVGFYCYSMALYGAEDFIALDWDNKHIMRINSSGGVNTHCETIKRGRVIYANNQQEIVAGVPKD